MFIKNWIKNKKNNTNDINEMNNINDTSEYRKIRMFGADNTDVSTPIAYEPAPEKDISQLKKIPVFGADNSAIEQIPEVYEQLPEVETRHKNFAKLTKVAFALLFILLSQSAIFIIYRLMLQFPLFISVFPLIITTLIILMGIGLYILEKHTFHALSYTNIIMLISGEIITIVVMFLIYHFDIPGILKFSFVFSIVFSIYVLIFLKSKILLKLAICIFVSVIFIQTDIVTLRPLDFDTSYIYISTVGYRYKPTNENHYYIENIGNNKDVPTLKLGEVRQFADFTETLAASCTGVRSVTGKAGEVTLESLNELEVAGFKFGEVVNFHGRYDEEFFKKKSLYFSAIKIRHPFDTVEVTGFKYSEAFGRLLVDYTIPHPKSNSFATEEEGAFCILVFEVDKAEEEKLLTCMPPLLATPAAISYT
ncbi:MAG: hypothetical protein UD936_09200 [Acutalibacteraceae bacterium]|nr:hypothetical protein [Acutalibacteraceae bacterium]